MNCFISLRLADRVEAAFDMLSFGSLEEAYLDACAAIPDMAADLLRKRRNPFRCAYLICDEAGGLLLEIPFTDILPPSERDGIVVEKDWARRSAGLRLQMEIERSHGLIRRSAELRLRASNCIDASRGMMNHHRSTLVKQAVAGAEAHGDPATRAGIAC